jgi:sugar (pentulose or hexulose) kinase
MRRADWPQMLEALGIGEDRLPDIVEPGQLIGPIRPEVARELGLSARTLVATGALDQACGAIGVGNIRPGLFSECTGSNVTVVTLVARPTIDPNRQLPCFYFGLPDTYMMHAFSMTGGLVLLPHFQGAGPPESNLLARGVLYGLTLAHTRAHVVRAILESIALIVHRMIDAVRDMGIEVSEIRSLGGGAKSELWNQIKADVNGLPVTTMRNTEDAACLGATVLAGAAAGVWLSVGEAVARFVAVKRRFEPLPGNREAYAELYATYALLYAALEPVFAARAPGGSA